MIVNCPRCQARFRVADEKVGPRGAKVRCSRCKDVFVVQREAAPPAAPPRIELVELTPGLARAAPAFDPFAASAPGPAAEVFDGAAPQGRSPAPDPFAAAGLEAFGEAAPPGQAADDPFAAATGSDPFDVAPPTRSSTALPVTDLSQLLGGAPLPSVEPPAPTDDGAPPAPPAFADLALEERGTPGPAPFADPADVFLSAATPAPGPLAGAAFEGGLLAQVPVGEESLALASERTPLPPEASEHEPAPAEEPSPPAPRPRAAPGRARDEGAAPTAAPPSQAPGPAARLRSAAVSALALVVLLAVALAFRVVWRGEATLGPAAFRPSTLLRGLGGTPPPSGTFELSGVRSGLYEQSGGGAVLFVRGEVVSHAAAPVDAVHVEAELLRDGQVLARGEAQAGGVPTPEEVYQATDRAALEKLGGELRTRAPRVVAPGERLGFVVVLGDAPADVRGTTVRVRADAGSGEARQ